MTYDLKNMVVVITGETVTVPRQNKLAAIAPGFARKLVERFRFNDKLVQQAMALTNPHKA